MRKIMRIAIVTENFLPKLDGVTRTLSRLLEHLNQYGHEALLLGPESRMVSYAGAEIVGTVGVPLPFYPELKMNFFRPLFLQRLRSFQPDIVHLVDPVMLGVGGLAAARLLGKPLISSYHTNLATYCGQFGFPYLIRPMWSYNRFLHNQCSLTFCPSPSTASILRARGFEHIRIWPRGVDIQLFQPERRNNGLRASWMNGGNNDEGKTVLLYTGRISWEKNLRLLIRAYREMDHQSYHLVMVGDGPALQEVKQELATVPVTFTGYLQGDELSEVYASADIFTFPSQTETFGQVVLEAMASGLPIVGLQSEGVGDLVEDGKTGYLLDATSLTEEEQAHKYRHLVERLSENQQLRRTMANAAMRAASLRTWNASMQNLLQGYEETIRNDTPMSQDLERENSVCI